jgi:pilus assembly protein CpaB
MRGRLLILIGLIVLIAVIAVVLLNSGILNPAPQTTSSGTPVAGQANQAQATQGPTPTPVPLVRIVQALQNLPRGYRFPNRVEELTDIVGYTTWPEEAVPFNALREDQGGLEGVLGKVARTDIFREQPILSTLLVEDLTQIANVGSDLGAVLPSDRVAIAIPTDRYTSVAYGIQAGDHVDVILSMLFVDVDEVFQSIIPNRLTLFTTIEGTLTLLETIEGRPDQSSLGPVIVGPSERQRPRLVTQRTIQDAIVMHVGEFPESGRYIGVLPTPTTVATAEAAPETAGGTPAPVPTAVPRPNIATLAVSPQYAVVLAWAIEARLPITLVVRSAIDTSRVPTQAVTMDYVMSEFRIDLPARRDFSIEPAIRSIRQLIAASEIDFGTQQNQTQATSGQ